MNKEILNQLQGMLSALLLFLGVIGMTFDWFNEEVINAFVILVGAIALFVNNIYRIYKNHYGFSKKAKQEKVILEHAKEKKGGN